MPDSAEPHDVDVPPPATFFSADDLREKVEAFAPRRHRKHRDRLFDDLRRDLGNTPGVRGLDDPYVFVLAAIRTAHGIARPRTEATSRPRRSASRCGRVPPLDAKTYSAELRALRAQLEQIASHRLVRRFPLHTVEVYSRAEVVCPHGRNRRDCEDIGQKLELFNARHLMKYLPNRRRALVQELKRASVNPEKHTAADFCTPLPIDEDAVLDGPWFHLGGSRAGRPVDLRRGYLLETILPVLTDRGMLVARAVEHVAGILGYCFADPVTPNTLRRQWERLQNQRTRLERSARQLPGAGSPEPD